MSSMYRVRTDDTLQVVRNKQSDIELLQMTNR